MCYCVDFLFYCYSLFKEVGGGGYVTTRGRGLVHPLFFEDKKFTFFQINEKVKVQANWSQSPLLWPLGIVLVEIKL